MLSGDTRYCENVIAHAGGADLLVHEVAMTRPHLMEIDRIRRVIGHHSTPKDAARVFAKCMPGLAVFNHIVLIGDSDNAPPSVEDLIEATRQEYDGAFVVGEDLMTFTVGESITTEHLAAQPNGSPLSYRGRKQTSPRKSAVAPRRIRNSIFTN